jgi:hypothetical protein
MVKPQQPELRRSDRGATSDDAVKESITSPNIPSVDGGARGPIPEDNLPGHHPEHEQDKPSGQDFVAKMHALAQEEQYDAPTTDDEVVDLTQANPQESSRFEPGSDRVERIAAMAGKTVEGSVKLTAKLVGRSMGMVLDRMPGRPR